MPRGSVTLRLIMLSVAVVANAAAQQEPRPPDLPGAPVAKQESTHQQHQNPFNTTIEVLGRRSIFFPEIATSRGSLSTKQKLDRKSTRLNSSHTVISYAVFCLKKKKKKK